ncbi:MAG: hypothetical protein J6J60_07805 [Clostridia bacterium]|nr:hypothetical protein [Clostridia bacterium]
MQKTNEKVQNLNYFIDRRTQLLNALRLKEDITNFTQNDNKNLAKEFEDILAECKLCDARIKRYKSRLEPHMYLSFEEENNEYSNNNPGTALILKQENKIINWFKNKINEFRYNYCLERAVKRDNFLESNITNQIDSYNAYLNVLKSKGNKAIFTKNITKVVNISKNEITENKI